MALNIQDPTIKTMDGTKLEAVRNFTYLRAWMASIEKDMKVRKALAWKALHSMRKVWKLKPESRIEDILQARQQGKLTHAFVTSRLDNLTSLLVRMPAYQIAKLQLIQNHAARIATEQRRSCHITPILKDLH